MEQKPSGEKLTSEQVLKLLQDTKLIDLKRPIEDVLVPMLRAAPGDPEVRWTGVYLDFPHT